MTPTERPEERDSQERYRREMKRDAFDAYYIVNAEGHRIGLMACRACGATVILADDDSENWPERHERWHDELATLDEALKRLVASSPPGSLR